VELPSESHVASRAGSVAHACATVIRRRCAAPESWAVIGRAASWSVLAAPSDGVIVTAPPPAAVTTAITKPLRAR
jgi:hypothetical protein